MAHWPAGESLEGFDLLIIGDLDSARTIVFVEKHVLACMPRACLARVWPVVAA